MSQILILGAGFGGITAALELRRLLPEGHHVAVVDRQSHFLMGLAKLWALDGRRSIDAGRRPLERLRARGVDLVLGTVDRIDVSGKQVVVAGRPLPYDHLIIALGAQLDAAGLPGFSAAHNLYDPAGITALSKALESLGGGRILFFVSSTPFKCPPAPYEAAMLTSHLLRRRGVRETCEIELTTPEARPLPIGPASCSADLKAHLDANGIRYLPDHKPKAVWPDRRLVEYENGATRTYDLLVGVPPHRAPDVVRASGLTDASGWIAVDARTLQTAHREVYALGDVAFVKTPSGKPLPKAGVLAEAQAKVVAANLAAQIQGQAPSARFDGRGYCFIELGDGLATAVDGEFFAQPEPVLTLRPPSAKALHEKEDFERSRLAAWFGS